MNGHHLKVLRRRRQQPSDPKAWWATVRRSAPSNLAGLWFGIVELARPQSGWHLYVAGTATFDPADETAEWAVPEYAWWPEGRYFRLPQQIDELGPLLDQATAIVTALRPWQDMAVDGAAVGFDDGDFTVLHQSAR